MFLIAVECVGALAPRAEGGGEEVEGRGWDVELLLVTVFLMMRAAQCVVDVEWVALSSPGAPGGRWGERALRRPRLSTEIVSCKDYVLTSELHGKPAFFSPTKQPPGGHRTSSSW
jgi:hypothetical protein